MHIVWKRTIIIVKYDRESCDSNAASGTEVVEILGLFIRIPS